METKLNNSLIIRSMVAAFIVGGLADLYLGQFAGYTLTVPFAVGLVLTLIHFFNLKNRFLIILLFTVFVFAASYLTLYNIKFSGHGGILLIPVFFGIPLIVGLIFGLFIAFQINSLGTPPTLESSPSSSSFLMQTRVMSGVFLLLAARLLYTTIWGIYYMFAGIMPITYSLIFSGVEILLAVFTAISAFRFLKFKKFSFGMCWLTIVIDSLYFGIYLMPWLTKVGESIWWLHPTHFFSSLIIFVFLSIPFFLITRRHKHLFVK